MGSSTTRYQITHDGLYCLDWETPNANPSLIYSWTCEEEPGAKPSGGDTAARDRTQLTDPAVQRQRPRTRRCAVCR